MTQTINCEECGHEIDIEQTLGKKISSELHLKYKSRYQDREIELDKKSQSLAEKEKAIEDNVKKQDELINSIVSKKAVALKAEFEESQKERDVAFREETKKELETNFKSEMEEANKKNIENNELKTENIKLAARINSIDSLHKSDIDMQVTEARNQEIKKSSEDKELMKQEHAEKMKQMEKNLKDAHQQAEQGSMQVQGEAQEVIIEEFLKYNFPTDLIEPVKQGALGADCIQHVKTNNNQDCGSIYYESKRTKDFRPAWIEKLKGDMRAKNINVGVLATKAMPKDMDRAGFINNIYVCSLDEFKTISYVLRRQLIEINKIRNIGENRQDIASHLYKYLTSSEFRMDMEAIVEGFTEMKSDIDSEKRAQNRLWNKREKSLEKIMLSTVSMYGSLQGIDNSLETIKGLDLPGIEYEQIEEKEKYDNN